MGSESGGCGFFGPFCCCFSKLVVCGSSHGGLTFRKRVGIVRGFLWVPKINRTCKGSERGIGLKTCLMWDD